MRRRVLLASVAATTLLPGNALAQQRQKLVRIGYLSDENSSSSGPYVDAFLAGLRDLGYVEGRDIQFEARFADSDNNRLKSQAVELVGLNVDVIVTYAARGIIAARNATATIPIVMVIGPNLIPLGFAASLARPGGNVTGSEYHGGALMNKRLEFLKEIDPSMSRVGVLLSQGVSVNAAVLENMGATARALNLELRPREVSGPSEYGVALSAWVEEKLSGFVVHDNSRLVVNAKVIAAVALQHRLLSIGPLELPAGGGLMAYGVDFVALFRHGAYFVDKILKGTKVGDIPIEQPIKFRFVLNLKTAKALGLTISPYVLARADEVIE